MVPHIARLVVFSCIRTIKAEAPKRPRGGFLSDTPVGKPGVPWDGRTIKDLNILKMLGKPLKVQMPMKRGP